MRIRTLVCRCSNWRLELTMRAYYLLLTNFRITHRGGVGGRFFIDIGMPLMLSWVLCGNGSVPHTSILGNSVVISSPEISKLHARISCKNGAFLSLICAANMEPGSPTVPCLQRCSGSAFLRYGLRSSWLKHIFIFQASISLDLCCFHIISLSQYVILGLGKWVGWQLMLLEIIPLASVFGEILRLEPMVPDSKQGG
ncbi:hypothetical protein Tco_0401907 [Tanacetum coccineum]